MNKENVCCLIRDLLSQLKNMRNSLELSNNRMDSLDKSMSQLTSEIQKVSQHLTTHDHHIQEKIAPQIKPTCPSNAHLLQVRISGIPEKVVSSDERNKQEMIITHDHSAISEVFEKLGETCSGEVAAFG